MSGTDFCTDIDQRWKRLRMNQGISWHICMEAKSWSAVVEITIVIGIDMAITSRSLAQDKKVLRRSLESFALPTKQPGKILVLLLLTAVLSLQHQLTFDILSYDLTVLMTHWELWNSTSVVQVDQLVWPALISWHKFWKTHRLKHARKTTDQSFEWQQGGNDRFPRSNSLEKRCQSLHQSPIIETTIQLTSSVNELFENSALTNTKIPGRFETFNDRTLPSLDLFLTPCRYHKKAFHIQNVEHWRWSRFHHRYLKSSPIFQSSIRTLRMTIRRVAHYWWFARLCANYELDA